VHVHRVGRASDPSDLLPPPGDKVEVRVAAGVAQRFPHRGQKHFKLGVGHANGPEGLAAHGVDEALDGFSKVHADEALRFVLGPRPDRRLDDPTLHILKACLAEMLLVLIRNQVIRPVLGHGLAHESEALVERVVVGHGAVVAQGVAAKVGELDPAAGPEVLVALGEQPVHVLEVGARVAHVDEVVGPIRDPVVLDVVDDETHVGGHPEGLDGAEVDAYDLGAGVVVGDFNGPEAGTSAQVKNPLRVVTYGSVEELPITRLEVDNVLSMFTTLLNVVVGYGIPSMAVVMILQIVNAWLVPYMVVE
jgi:hypothetical protein